MESLFEIVLTAISCPLLLPLVINENEGSENENDKKQNCLFRTFKSKN